MMHIDLDVPRRRALLGGAAAACAWLAGAARAADAPLKTLRIVVGFPAGGSTDVVARHVAQALHGELAETTLVENRSGASGQVAILALKTAPADGSMLLLTPSSMLTLFPHTYPQLGYDPVRDLLPVSLACRFDLGFAVGPLVDPQVGTLAEFVAWARAHPESATFGSPAAGSSSHFVGAMLGRSGQVALRHVPYRGAQPSIVDLVGGRLAATCTPLGDLLPMAEARRLRLLAVSGAARSRFVPEVPTFVELGLAEIVADGWLAFYLPSGAGPGAARRLNAALRTALARPELVQALAAIGLEAAASSEAELAALQRRDTERWAAMAKEFGFRAE